MYKIKHNIKINLTLKRVKKEKRIEFYTNRRLFCTQKNLI